MLWLGGFSFFLMRTIVASGKLLRQARQFIRISDPRILQILDSARQGLRIVDMPVRYRRRRAGVTKVRVVRHGVLLIAMSVIAFRKFKLARWTRAWR